MSPVFLRIALEEQSTPPQPSPPPLPPLFVPSGNVVPSAGHRPGPQDDPTSHDHLPDRDHPHAPAGRSLGAAAAAALGPEGPSYSRPRPHFHDRDRAPDQGPERSHGHSHSHGPPTTTAELVGELSAGVNEAVAWVLLGVVLTVTLEWLQLLPLPLIRAHLHCTGAGPAVLLPCLKAAALGLVTPLCSCGALPVAMGLMSGGASLPSLVAFLTAAQSAGLDSAAITYGLLGPRAAVLRLAGAFFIAVCAGLCAPAEAKGPPAAADAGGGGGTGDPMGEGPAEGVPCAAGGPAAGCCADDSGSDGDAGGGGRTGGPIALMGESLAEVVPYVTVGIALTVALRALAPSTEVLFAQAGIAGRVMALVAVLPLQLCEHTTVAVAAALQKAGASPGTAFAVLLAAPATNIATLMVLSRRAVSGVARMAAALVLAPLALSLAVDALQADMLVEAEIEEVFTLPAWYMGGGAVVITVVLLLAHYATAVYRAAPRKAATGASRGTKAG